MIMRHLIYNLIFIYFFLHHFGNLHWVSGRLFEGAYVLSGCFWLHDVEMMWKCIENANTRCLEIHLSITLDEAKLNAIFQCC